MERITQLSGGTVLAMCEKPAQKIFNDDKYVLQVLQFREIDTTSQRKKDEPKETKKNALVVKAKLFLSDGLSHVTAMISESDFNKLVSSKKLRNQYLLNLTLTIYLLHL